MSFMWHNITSKATVNKPSSQEKKNAKKLKQNKTLHLKKKSITQHKDAILARQITKRERLPFSNLEPVWVSFFHHSISVTQFASLITHHSFFHTHLATSLLFSSLNFFTLSHLSASTFFFFQYPTHRS